MQIEDLKIQGLTATKITYQCKFWTCLIFNWIQHQSPFPVILTFGTIKLLLKLDTGKKDWNKMDQFPKLQIYMGMKIHGLVEIQRTDNFMLDHLSWRPFWQRCIEIHQISLAHWQTKIFYTSQKVIIGNQIPEKLSTKMGLSDNFIWKLIITSMLCLYLNSWDLQQIE